MAGLPISPDELSALKETLKNFCMREMGFNERRAETWSRAAIDDILEDERLWDNDRYEKGGEA